MSCNSCYSSNPCFGNHPNNPSVINCGVDPYYARKTNTNYVHYVGPNLPCVDINTCETLTVIIQKIDAALCGDNLSETIINTILNNSDIRNLWQTVINNLIQCSTVVACISTTTTTSTSSTSTTSTTTTQCVCSTFAVFNDYDFPINTQFVDCNGNVVSTSVGCNCDPIIICACESSIDPNSLLTFVKLSDDCIDIPKLPNCAVLLNEKNGADSKIYYYNVATNISTPLIIPGVIESDDIAHTTTKLWMYTAAGGDTLIHEWNITLNPFTAIFNRIITVPGFTFGKGLCAKDNNTLITSDNTVDDIYEINISTNTGIPSYQFSMGLGRYVTGDMILTTTGKLIVTNTQADNKYISQFDYSSGALEVDIDITGASGSATSLFESGTDIYLGFCESVAATSYVANYLKDWPYNVLSTDILGYCPSGGSIPPECATEQFLTTTSTTTSPTLCYCYEVDASLVEATIEWVDCVNGPQTQVIDGSIAYVCAEEGTVNVTFSSGPVTPVQGSLCTEGPDCWPAFNVQATNVTKFNFRQIKSTLPYIIDWGDGNITSYSSGTNNCSPATPPSACEHVYSAPYTGNISIKCSQLSAIKILRTDQAFGIGGSGTALITGAELSKLTGLEKFYSISTIFNGDVTDLPSTLLELECLLGTLTGSISLLPSNLTRLNITGSNTNTLSGDINSLPSSLAICVILGNNNVSGDMTTFGATHASLVTFNIQGSNSIDGNISGIPASVTSFTCYGNNELVGSISSLPANITKFDVIGWNSIDGNLSSLVGKPLTFFRVDSSPTIPPLLGNSITGDIANIPDSVTTTIIGGSNTVTGNISDIPTGLTATSTTFDVRGVAPGGNTISGNISITPLHSNLKYFTLQGDNVISGDIADIPSGMIEFNVAGGNTLSGNLGDAPTSLKIINIRGNNTITTYNGKTWTSGMKNVSIFSVAPASIMVQPDLDNLIIDLATYSWQVPSMTFTPEINLRGNLGTSAPVVAAYNTLTITRNVSVTITPYP